MISHILSESKAALIGLALVSVAACGSGTNPPVATSQTAVTYEKTGDISVVFYNVENLFDTLNDPQTADDEYTPGTEKNWNTERYQTKLGRLAEVLSRISEDLPIFIGLAEVENEQVLLDLVEHPLLKNGNYGVVHKDSPDERGIDVALLYRKAHFTPAHMNFHEVSLPDTERPTRDILHARGQIKGGPEVYLFVNHWPSRGGGKDETAQKRMLAAAALGAEIERTRDIQTDAFIIAMGDFNDYPGDASLNFILETGMVNLMEGLKETERGSYNYRGDWDFLDQILVSTNLTDGLGFDIVGGSITAFHFPEMLYTDPKYGDEKPNKTYGGDNYYGGYSDHLPVIARFKY